MKKCLVFVLPVVEVAQDVLEFGEVCFELQAHQEFQGSFVIAREFLKVIDCMFVSDEPHDLNSFSELFPQYSLFNDMLYCFEPVSYPSFFFAHHKAFVPSLTGVIDFTSAALFLSQFLHPLINDLREDGIH